MRVSIAAELNLSFTCFTKHGQEYILVLFNTLLKKSFVVADFSHNFRIFKDVGLLISFVFGYY